MRNIKNIKLDDNRSVTLLELRVRDVRRAMGEAKNLENISIDELIGERFNEVAHLLGDCVQLPEGETLEDLTFSEITAIKNAFIEVNTAFLDLMGLAGLFPLIPSATSIEPASSSSNEATPA